MKGLDWAHSIAKHYCKMLISFQGMVESNPVVRIAKRPDFGPLIILAKWVYGSKQMGQIR